MLQRTGPAAYLDFGRLGGIWSSSPLGRHARDALAGANANSDYTRRLGLVPNSYGATIAGAIEKATGRKPTLKTVANALDALRASLWDSASASFRAAHDARTWVYENDPADRLLEVEEDRYAIFLFERERNKRRGIRRPRKRINTRVKHQLKASKGKRGKRASRQPTRRSVRTRMRKKDAAFYWNFGDEYVQALDEVSAMTSGRIHALYAFRKGRAKRGLMCLV